MAAIDDLLGVRRLGFASDDDQALIAFTAITRRSPSRTLDLIKILVARGTLNEDEVRQAYRFLKERDLHLLGGPDFSVHINRLKPRALTPFRVTIRCHDWIAGLPVSQPSPSVTRAGSAGRQCRAHPGVHGWVVATAAAASPPGVAPHR